MRKSSLLFILIGLLVFSTTLSLPTRSYGKIEEGTYDIHYEMIDKEGEHPSEIDDYFVKPATLKISKDKKEVQMMVTEASRFKNVKVFGGILETILEIEEEDLRLIVIELEKDSSESFLLSMKVDGAEEKVKVVLDVSTLKQEEEEEENNNTNKDEENDQNLSEVDEEHALNQRDTHSRASKVVKGEEEGTKRETIRSKVPREIASYKWIPITLTGLVIMIVISLWIYRSH